MTNEPAASAAPSRPAPPPRALLAPGDRAPTFRARTDQNPGFQFDSAAGRWLVLGFVGSAAAPGIARRIDTLTAAADLFDDSRASLFLVTSDPDDEHKRRLVDRVPGCRVFRDHDGAVARLYGALPQRNDGSAPPAYAPHWLLIDPCLTIRRVIPLRQDGGDADDLLDALRAAPPTETYLGFVVPAPILILPDVFEPAFCDHLIGLYEAAGGEVSGFMRDEGGKTVATHDPGFKVRRDFMIEDEALRGAVQARVIRRVIPQIERVHFFRATRMERYLVACYDAAEGGHFRPHRDNTTLGTAHRRFAVSINLNDGFQGGEVGFPEYGPQGYKAPRGAAVVFSCSLLHAVGKVTSGRRYAFLPFLYDDTAAAIRERNAAQVPTAANYRA